MASLTARGCGRGVRKLGKHRFARHPEKTILFSKQLEGTFRTQKRDGSGCSAPLGGFFQIRASSSPQVVCLACGAGVFGPHGPPTATNFSCTGCGRRRCTAPPLPFSGEQELALCGRCCRAIFLGPALYGQRHHGLWRRGSSLASAAPACIWWRTGSGSGARGSCSWFAPGLFWVCTFSAQLIATRTRRR